MQGLSLEDERQLEDQQRTGQDDLLEQEIDELEDEIDKEVEEALGGGRSGSQSSEVQAEGSGKHMDFINFKMYDRGLWKQAASHAIDGSDDSGIETAATNYVRENWRLFNAELRMFAPHQCHEAVIADRTYNVFLMREQEINVNSDIRSSVMKVGAEATKAVPHI